MDGELLNDERWLTRCLARLTELDPKLDPALALPIAEDLCGRPRWRAMAPETAAQIVFDGGAVKGSGSVASAVGRRPRDDARSAE